MDPNTFSWISMILMDPRIHLHLLVSAFSTLNNWVDVEVYHFSLSFILSLKSTPKLNNDNDPTIFLFKVLVLHLF